MDYVSLIYAQFASLGPRRKIRKLSENSLPDGATIECAIDELKIDCNWSYRDFSVMVTSDMEADGWSDDWAECYYLLLYLEGANDSEVSTELREPPRLLNWLVQNFDTVYLLMCSMDHAARKANFFDFQARERKEKSEREVLAFKRERGEL